MLVKNDIITVAIEMEEFKVENALGYDAWEATVCYQPKLLQRQGGVTFKAGPQGNQVTSPEGDPGVTKRDIAQAVANATNLFIHLATFHSGTDPGGSHVHTASATGHTGLVLKGPDTDVKDEILSCFNVGAAVGPGEAGSLDKGNLVNIDFLCVTANKNITVLMLAGNVIAGDGKKINQIAGAPEEVSIDCRTGRISASATGGFYTEPDLLKDGTKNPRAGEIQVKDGKIKVTVRIDDLKTLVDKDQNPVDGGGWTSLESDIHWNGATLEVQAAGSDKTVAALVPCTGNTNDEVEIVDNFSGGIHLDCDSDKSQLVSDENQGVGDVFTVTFVCKGGDFAERQTTITLSQNGDAEMRDENNELVNVFIQTEVITVRCIGPNSNLDGDDCDQEQEEFINGLSQELAGIDFMDKNVYDFPDGSGQNDDGNITIGDILEYVQNFGRGQDAVDNPPLGQDQGEDIPASTVRDVTNDDTIGADDILRAALLFGVSCK